MDRYEKALAKARAGKSLEEIFPELKESEDERIRKAIMEVLKRVSGATDVLENQGTTFKKAMIWLEKKEEQTEELSIRLNGLMQEYVKSGEDEEEQEHRLKCYQLFWDALGDSEFFEQKEQKPNIELIKQSWYMEGYHDRKFCKEPKWILKTGEYGPKYELNPRYGEPLSTEQKPAENDTRTKIISRAKNEKQVVLLSESNGNAEIDWDTRSLEDTKKLLEHGVAFVNKRLGMKPAERSYPYGRNETADMLVSLAECLEMDGDCLLNEHTGTEWGKFLRDLARKQAECKQWSNDDKEMLMKVEQIVLKHWNTLSDSFYHKYDDENQDAESCYNWLKTLPERFNLQPKQEWRRYIWAINLRFNYDGLVRYEDNGSYEIVTAGNKPKRQVNGEYILLKDISSTD